MVKSFRHRGLKQLFEDDDAGKIRADQRNRISDVLFHLDRAQSPRDLDLPGYRLHALKGDRKGYWSVTISGNWRITFRFEDGRVRRPRAGKTADPKTGDRATGFCGGPSRGGVGWRGRLSAA